jgi:hypothetical protein
MQCETAVTYMPTRARRESEPAITLVLGHLRVPKKFLFLEIYYQMGQMTEVPQIRLI